jgi:hypothetical protein
VDAVQLVVWLSKERREVQRDTAPEHSALQLPAAPVPNWRTDTLSRAPFASSSNREEEGAQDGQEGQAGGR